MKVFRMIIIWVLWMFFCVAAYTIGYEKGLKAGNQISDEFVSSSIQQFITGVKKHEETYHKAPDDKERNESK